MSNILFVCVYVRTYVNSNKEEPCLRNLSFTPCTFTWHREKSPTEFIVYFWAPLFFSFSFLFFIFLCYHLSLCETCNSFFFFFFRIKKWDSCYLGDVYTEIVHTWNITRAHTISSMSFNSVEKVEVALLYKFFVCMIAKFKEQ